MTNRILICDDEFPITKAAALKLTRCGYQVEAHHDGQAAWDAYETARPMMLITDLQMPRLDGLSLIRRIRVHDSNLPIILLTAKGFEIDEAELAAEFGRFRLFAKPFSPRELASAVDEMVHESSATPSAELVPTS